MIGERPGCWCGGTALEPFSPGYLRCPTCQTLVSRQMPAGDPAEVTDDARDFYGRQYWFAYQEETLGHPNIVARARTDLPERCLHWLRIALRYTLPPARVVEVGSSHGGFVALMRWAGFDATGLELSPWVVDFSRETFGIPVLAGPVERQSIDAGCLDAIVMMDVLEHLRDPLGTMRHCLGLLREDGVLLIQTPGYPEGRSYEAMMAAGDRFLECLQPPEHLYLFTPRSLRDFFHRLGATHVTFEPPVFPDYDMFPVVSRRPLRPHSVEAIERALIATPGGRLVQALIDLGAERDALGRRYVEAEQDRTARLEALRAHGDRLGLVEAERNTLGAEAAALREALAAAEADRAARLEVILQQGEQLGLQREQLAAQAQQFAAQEQQLRVVARQLRMLQNVLAMVERSPVVRLLRRLGYWRRVEAALTPPPGTDVGA